MGMKMYPECVAKGQETEDKFNKACTKKGWKITREATENENKYGHWDKLVNIDGQDIKVEVKGKKATSRGMETQSELILLELHGVLPKCNKGWIYGSEAKIVAFETGEDFTCFHREDLIKFIKEKTEIVGPDDNKIHEKRKLARKSEARVSYQVYHRVDFEGKDRNDAFIWVPYNDLLNLKHIKIKK